MIKEHSHCKTLLQLHSVALLTQNWQICGVFSSSVFIESKEIHLLKSPLKHTVQVQTLTRVQSSIYSLKSSSSSKSIPPHTNTPLNQKFLLNVKNYTNWICALPNRICYHDAFISLACCQKWIGKFDTEETQEKTVKIIGWPCSWNNCDDDYEMFVLKSVCTHHAFYDGNVFAAQILLSLW